MVGSYVTPDNVIKLLLSSYENWNAVYFFCEESSNAAEDNGESKNSRNEWQQSGNLYLS